VVRQCLQRQQLARDTIVHNAELVKSLTSTSIPRH